MKTFTGTGHLRNVVTRDMLDHYGVKPKGVLHIGAHDGEEIPLYQDLGFNPIYMVEPAPGPTLRKLIEGPRALALEIRTEVVDNVDPGARVPWVADGVRSGVRTQPGCTYVRAYPLSYMQQRCPGANVLIVDTSGTELNVLVSGDVTLYDMIIVETDTEARYASGHLDVVRHLDSTGFRPVERHRHGEHSYADVVFVR